MLPLRVLVDGHFLGKPYGFGRFAAELCRALHVAAEPDVEVHVAVPERVAGQGLPAHSALAWHPLPEPDPLRWEQVVLPRLARRLGADVLHAPYNSRPLRSPAPTVVTVHDLMFLTDRVPLRRVKDRAWTAYTRAVFRAAVPRSAAVVSVSDATRRDLARLGVTATTVHNTVDGFVAAHPPRGHRDGAPYLLHRGGAQAHRNTARVVAAFRAAAPRLPGVEMRVVGVPDGALRFPEAAGLPVRFLPRVSDQELADLYAGSLAVVATSLQEGFGLPVLEGLSFGAPVLTSDRDPMREVAGDAALLVDPTDVAVLAEALVRLGTDAALRAALVARGRDRAQAFSAAEVGRRMLAVYRAAARREPLPAAG